MADRSLILATTPRSGSWLLADFVSRAPGVTPCREYFHPGFVAATCRQMGLPPVLGREYVDALVDGPEVLAAKLHWLQLAFLVRGLRELDPDAGPTDAALIARQLPGPRYVQLVRADKARQAISLWRALRTDQWWLTKGAGTPAPPLSPDLLAIRWLEDDLVAQEEGWTAWFRDNDIEPLVVTYESLVEDPAGAAAESLALVGIGMPVDPQPPRTHRQADGFTEEVLASYLVVRDELPALPDGWAWRTDLGTHGPARTDPPTARLTPF